MKERKNFALDLFKQTRGDASNRAKLVNDKLFIKGQYQHQFARVKLPPLQEDTIPLADVDDQIISSDSVSDSGSVFCSYAATAHNMTDVSLAVNRVLLQPGVASASHVIYAYRVQDGDDVMENFESDSDHGLGLELLRTLRQQKVMDTVCVTVRMCSPDYRHLGDKRFQYVRDTAKEAIDKL